MILVDTHVVAWLAFDQSQLSKNARAAIDDGNRLAIYDITLLESTTLSSKGHIRLNISVESFLHEVEARFIVHLSAAEHARALELPAAKDPAGRIIGGATLVEGLAPLLTVPIPGLKRILITWFAPIITPTPCLCSPPRGFLP